MKPLTELEWEELQKRVKEVDDQYCGIGVNFFVAKFTINFEKRDNNTCQIKI